MSRCFPYPPPGYTLSGAKNEILIESIKLQKEKVKERKEKRKEKKERRKERKERRKAKKDKANQIRGNSVIENHLISDDKFGIRKHDISQKSIFDAKIEPLRKKGEAENNQLEQSSLTEEHACAVALFDPSSSSESTENSKKRKRHSPSGDDDACGGNGKAILIRFPSKKQNELDALVKEQEQPCSTSGRIDPPSKTGDANHVKDWRDSFPNVARTNGRKIRNKANLEPVLSSMQRMDLQYRNLFENLRPPPVQEPWLHSNDLDWLLNDNCRHDQEKRIEKKVGSGKDGLPCSRRLGLWPQAEYLHEVDVYALPFTVPY